MRDRYKELIKKVGLGFHSNIPISEYEHFDGTAYVQSFFGKEAQEMQYLLHELWQFYGMNIQAVGFEIFNELFPEDYELLYGDKV